MLMKSKKDTSAPSKGSIWIATSFPSSLSETA